MSLVADYGTSSSSEDSDSSDSNSNVSNEKNEEIRKSTNVQEKLPAPNFENATPKTSVFSNPFIEEENAKQAILEKHVKMVNTRENTTIINGKKICWNYRKGRCRFGTKCQFAHDSDLQKSQSELDEQNKIQQNVICENLPAAQVSFMNADTLDEDNHINKKKRPGLTQGLVPGKKVMKMYKQQKLKSKPVNR